LYISLEKETAIRDLFKMAFFSPAISGMSGSNVKPRNIPNIPVVDQPQADRLP